MKPALIVLALIGLLFFAVLLGTRSNAANKGPQDQAGRMKLAQTFRPPGIVNLAGSALGRWSPKVRFAQTDYTVTAVPIQVQVPPADDEYRQAKIRVAPPHCADVTITYEAAEGEGADQKLDRQTWTGTEDEPCAGSFVVRPKGGTLTIACAPLQTCILTFE